MKKTTVDGKTLNQRTADMLSRAEARLGENLYVVQGSYNTGVSQSAGTHDGGGAIDVSPTSNPSAVVKALRDSGFAAWHRTANQGDWAEHIHAIAIGDPELSSGARAQVAEYYAGYDGLAGSGRDTGYRPDPIPVWPIKLPTVSATTVENQFKTDKPRKAVAVRRVQRILNERLGTNLGLDGVAGPKTKAAYKEFEKKINSTKVDSIPGPGELGALLAGFYRVVK